MGNQYGIQHTFRIEAGHVQLGFYHGFLTVFHIHKNGDSVLRYHRLIVHKENKTIVNIGCAVNLEAQLYRLRLINFIYIGRNRVQNVIGEQMGFQIFQQLLLRPGSDF